MMSPLEPHERTNWIGEPQVEADIGALIEAGALSHGWILAGPPGLGKATLAYRIARAVLTRASTIGEGLDVAENDKAAAFIKARSHPDLFVAEPLWDDKKAKRAKEISVDVIRKLSAFLTRTPSISEWRVVIIDTADDLNRNAANALLKALEEPPDKAVILLVCNAPGRLLPTIRSRCRRLDLRPLSDDVVVDFLKREGVDGAASRIARVAKGRPGYALRLSQEEGGEAVAAYEDYLAAAAGRGDIAPVVQSLTGKAGEARWRIFKPLLLGALSEAARARVRGEVVVSTFEALSPQTLLELWETLTAFFDGADALNLDRGQAILYSFRAMRRAADREAS